MPGPLVPAIQVQIPSEVDNEKSPGSASSETINIEHVLVPDDPRRWSNAWKNIILAIIAAASMTSGLSSNIQNPSIRQIKEDLHATSSDISLSLSLFIIIQGNAPLLWSAITEIKGRKLVYITSLALFTIGTIVVATSRSIALMIGMRCLQAVGSSAILSIGAATLADIFKPSERGTKMGIYYAAPMLGPSLGPIIGGGLTQAFNWRASFWFMAILGGLNLLTFLTLFKDTFRQERSTTYQTILARRAQERREQWSSQTPSQVTTIIGEESDLESPCKEKGPNLTAVDYEAQSSVGPTFQDNSLDDIKLSFKDVSPFRPIKMILSRLNNVATLVASGLFYAFSFSITYTTSRKLGIAYNYNSLQIGLVLLAFGMGGISGSVLGGRWSDQVLAKLTEKNNGIGVPEMRLRSTMIAMWIFPPSVIGYAWTLEKHVHISAICVMLFIAGFSSLCIYSSTLAYLVDANTGRSSVAVAMNSSFRGIAAFVATEVAVPLQDGIGDGATYSMCAGLMVIAELLVLVVIWKGGRWREKAAAKEEN